MRYQLEVGARTLEDALAAWRGGANRVELYVSPTEGALTPSAGLVRAVVEARRQQNFTLGLFAMLRPRAGDMFYSSSEFNIMQQDLEILLDQGIDGLMFGILSPDGELDVPRMRHLIQSAPGKIITLHRAFDGVRDPFRTLEQAVDLGIQYLLCGGFSQSGCWDRQLLPSLLERAAGRIQLVMALGPAFQTPQLGKILQETAFEQFHIVNGYRKRPSQMQYQPGIETPKDDYLQKTSSYVEYLEEQTVREIRNIMDQFERLEDA
ncbi:MAG: copper homeostasis protein CutC [Lentisphaeria bacterium]